MDFLQFSSNYLISGQCSGWSWWIHIFTHRTTIVTDETRKVVVDCIDYMTMSWPYLLVSMVCSQFLALEVGPFVRDHPGIPRCAFACLCSCVSEKKENERRLCKALGNIRLSLLVSCWWHVLREKRCETHSSPNEHVRRRSTRNSWMVCMDSGAISASRGAPLGAMIRVPVGKFLHIDDGWWWMMMDDGWWWMYPSMMVFVCLHFRQSSLHKVPLLGPEAQVLRWNLAIATAAKAAKWKRAMSLMLGLNAQALQPDTWITWCWEWFTNGKPPKLGEYSRKVSLLLFPLQCTTIWIFKIAMENSHW